ncbi:MAG: nucleotide exchange factor GrpE [Gemmatimonadota bacterium]
MWSDKKPDSEGDDVADEVVESGTGELDALASVDALPEAEADPEPDPESEPESEPEPDPESESEPNELEELRDRHLRLVAEFENFRKRTRREQAELRPAAQADLVRKLLPTLDDLARVSEIPHDSTTVEALDAGVELILRNLRKQLEESGLKRIEAVGKPFDPAFHEGILVTEVDDPEIDHTVSRVLLEGYEFEGRLVRPAQVEIYQYSAPSAETVDD